MQEERKNHNTSNRFYKIEPFGIPTISKSKGHLRKIKKSLVLIQNTDILLFRKVLRLRLILVFPGDSYYGVVFPGQRIYIDQPKAIRDSSIPFLASSIIHEAWHIDQHERGMRDFSGKAERGAYLVQRRFLTKTGSKREVKWLDREYGLKWWQPEDTAEKKQSGYDNVSTNKSVSEFRKLFKQYKQGKLKIEEI